MTDSAARPPSSPPRRPARRLQAAVVVLGVLALLAVALALAYGARREIARQAVTGWLESHGVEAELSFERFDLDGFTGRLRAGPKDNPDLVVDRVEVDMNLGWWWSPGGLGVNPTRVRLVHPVVRARLRGGELHFGSLDPLIQDFLDRPPRPDERGPLVLVERAEVRLTTEAGLLRVFGDARVDDGKLISLDAVMPAADLASGDLRAEVRRAQARARTTGDRLQVSLSGELRSLTSGDLVLRGADVVISGNGPYPDFETRRGDGAVSLRASLTAASLDWGASAGRDVALTAAFDGRSTGWLDTLRLAGGGRAAGRARTYSAADLQAGSLRAELTSADVGIGRTARGWSWSLQGAGALAAARVQQGGLRVEAPSLSLTALRAAGGPGRDPRATFRSAFAAERLVQGELSLRGLRGAFTGDAASDDGLRLALAGGLNAARGSWTVLGRPAAADEASVAALKRALADFRLSAPGLRLQAGRRTVLSATAPIRLLPASGGAAVVTARSGRPLFRSGPGPGGGFDLVVAGGALPRIDASVSDYAFADGRLQAQTSLRAAFDFGFVRGGEAQVAGTLRTGPDGGAFTASRCAVLSAERLEFGDNDIVAVAGRFCPAGGPLLRFGDGGWSASGRAESVDAAVPFLQIAFEDAAGPIRATGAGGGGLSAQVTSGSVLDTGEATRFHPLSIQGEAALADGDWTGDFRLSDHGYRVADLGLRHDGDAGAGGLTIDARGLEFSEGGLQPAGLTPLAEGVLGTAVAGRADFTGLVSWTREAAASSGRLTVAGLDFKSPLGQVSRLQTDVTLTSLAPLTSAPGQVATVEHLDAYLPVERIRVAFQLLPDAVRVEEGSFDAAGGRALFEPFTVPFADGSTWEGAVRVEGVELGRIIERSPFAERVELDAKVSGRLPFSVGPPGVRFAGGQLAAIQPGRLSIRRSALVGEEAVGGQAAAEAQTPDGAPVPVPPVGFNAQDFAYQALEHLAFDTLEAEVNSLAGGRLGVLLRLKGRHDPPTRQEIRLSWADVLARRFLDKPLPLPSDTGVNLTLDTTWNLDELLRSLRSVGAAREGLQDQRSETVQPPGR